MTFVMGEGLNYIVVVVVGLLLQMERVGFRQTKHRYVLYNTKVTFLYPTKHPGNIANHDDT